MVLRSWKDSGLISCFEGVSLVKAWKCPIAEFYSNRQKMQNTKAKNGHTEPQSFSTTDITAVTTLNNVRHFERSSQLLGDITFRSFVCIP